MGEDEAVQPMMREFALGDPLAALAGYMSANDGASAASLFAMGVQMATRHPEWGRALAGFIIDNATPDQRASFERGADRMAAAIPLAAHGRGL